jgi:hypothetical protein
MPYSRIHVYQMLLFDSRVKISQGILNSQALAKRYDKTGV